jgi:hypothetical protein
MIRKVKHVRLFIVILLSISACGAAFTGCGNQSDTSSDHTVYGSTS